MAPSENMRTTLPPGDTNAWLIPLILGLIAVILVIFIIIFCGNRICRFLKGNDFKPFSDSSSNTCAKPGGLINDSSSCYMNSIVHAVASSSVVMSKLKSLQSQYPKSSSLRCFVDLLVGINDIEISNENLSKNTRLLQNLIQAVSWTKQSQQDTFELLAALLKGINVEIHQYYPESSILLPMKIKLVHRIQGMGFSNKLQDHLGLQVPLSGNYSNFPGVKLVDLIKEFFSPSMIDEDPSKTTQIFMYQNPSDILLIQIQANKWNNETQKMIKPVYHIIYDECMSLELCVVDDIDNGISRMVCAEYKLTAFVKHVGDIENGHYVTYRQWDGDWFKVNDEHVQMCQFDKSICPYILIYERIE